MYLISAILGAVPSREVGMLLVLVGRTDGGTERSSDHGIEESCQRQGKGSQRTEQALFDTLHHHSPLEVVIGFL